MKTLKLLSTLALTIAFTGCYMNPPPQSGRDAPPEEQPAGEIDQPAGEGGEEGEVPPPAPGSEDSYGEGEQPVQVDPGPTW